MLKMVKAIIRLVLGIVSTIVAFIVGFQIVGSTSTDLTNAADNISNSGLPLASLFAANGVLLLVFMAFLFLGMMGVATGLVGLVKGN